MGHKRRLSGTEIPKPVAHIDEDPPAFDPTRAVRDLTKALGALSISDVHQPKSTSHQANRAPRRTGNNRLVALPCELRDMIYEYAFTQRVELLKGPQSVTERGAGFLLTCKQVYRESLPLYYEHTTFFSTNLWIATSWTGFSTPGICKWLRNVCWEHDARECGPSKEKCLDFFSTKSSATDYPPPECGKEVLKTFYYTPDGELVWCWDEGGKGYREFWLA